MHGRADGLNIARSILVLNSLSDKSFFRNKQDPALDNEK